MKPDSKRKQDGILRVTAYHRRDFNLALVRTRPYDHARVRASLEEPFPTKPSCGLGGLECLPSELISMICLQLDLFSYFRFRQVNRYARGVTSGISQYRVVAKHGLEGLRGLLRTRLALHFTIPHLYRAIVTLNCTLCGMFGGFLFLPRALRCCFNCIQSSPDLRVMSLSALSKAAKASTKRLCRFLPVLYTVPGIYSLNEVTRSKQLALVAEKPAIDTLKALGIWRSGLTRPRVPFEEVLRSMASAAFPYYDMDTTETQTGISCKGCQIRVEESDGDVRDRERVYSRDGFLEHFESCAEARILYISSREGTMPVDEPEFTRRRGYINELASDGLRR